MIKAVGEAGGKRFLLIGLSVENVRRLFEGMPIKFELPAPLDPTSNIIIVGGETEASIVDDLGKAGWLIPGVTEYHPDTNPATKG